MYKSSSSSGMKRDRLSTQDSSPPSSSMSKRSRVGGRYHHQDNNGSESDDGGNSPDGGGRGRHAGGGGGSRSGGSRGRDNSPGAGGGRRYDDYGGGGGSSGRSSSRHHRSSASASASSSSYPYKVLCMSRLHPKASDEDVRTTLYKEFRRYGDISVKVVNEPDERVAYVYFRTAEDARDAKHAKQPVYVYDRPVKVEAAYESTPTSAVGGYKDYDDGRGRNGGGYGGNRRTPPSSSSLPPPPSSGPPLAPYDHHHHRDARYDSRYDSRPPPMTYARDYGRRDDYRAPPHYGRYPPPGPPVGPPGPAPGIPPGPRHHPHHVPPHHDMHHPPPHHMMGGPPPRYENKKDRFPNYLQHVSPEEDPLATRTLFAGNLEVNITDEELRRIFGRYGIVEDIDIKRPPPGTGNAYAFVRFINLDMAARAKQELSGQYIGKFQCKIGYGKMNPTTKIWVGGLGPWTTLPMLEREFDRFGSIKKIDWAKGEPYAYITYETIDAAQAAVKDMRGYPLGGDDHKLRTDFADAGAPPVGSLRDYSLEYDTPKNGNSSERKEPNSPHSSATSLDRNALSSPNQNVTSDNECDLSGAKNINDIAKKATLGWQGSLILKNSSFPTKFYITDGEVDEGLMKDDEGKALLRITQRLRLDQAKLDDVLKRISSAPSHGIFLSMPSSSTVSSPSDDSNSAVQSRPLRNLISYLKQKEAAGVISLLNPRDASQSGVLYAFPPCAFSWELLKRTCTGLEGTGGGTELKDDHLVIVVIRGGVTVGGASA